MSGGGLLWRSPGTSLARRAGAGTLALLVAGCSLVGYPAPVAEIDARCDNDADDDLDGLLDAEEVSCAPVFAARRLSDPSAILPNDADGCPTELGWSGSPCRPPVGPRASVGAMPFVPPADYVYVSPTGAAGAFGTEADPVPTITEALALRPGVPVFVRVAAGTYVEELVLPPDATIIGDRGEIGLADDDVSVSAPPGRPAVRATGPGASLAGLDVLGDVVVGDGIAAAGLVLERVRATGATVVRANSILSGIDAELRPGADDAMPTLRVEPTGRAELTGGTSVAAPRGAPAILAENGRVTFAGGYVVLPTSGPSPLNGRAVRLDGPFAELRGERFAVLCPEPDVAGAIVPYGPLDVVIEVVGGANVELRFAWIETAGATALRVTHGTASVEDLDVRVVQTFLGLNDAEPPAIAVRSEPSFVPGPADPAVVIGRGDEPAILDAARMRIAGARGRALDVVGAGASASIEGLTILEVLEGGGEAVGVWARDGATLSIARALVSGAGEVGIRVGGVGAMPAEALLTDVDVVATGGPTGCTARDPEMTGECVLRPDPVLCGVEAACAATAAVEIVENGRAALLGLYAERSHGCGLRVTTFGSDLIQSTALVEGRFGLCVPAGRDVTSVHSSIEAAAILGEPERRDGRARILFRGNEDDGLGSVAVECLGATTGCGDPFDGSP